MAWPHNGNGNGKPGHNDAGYDEHVLREDTGVNTPEQYARFKAKYPYKGRGFPRRYSDHTPEEILYDPTRILGRGHRARMIPSGEMQLRQPRVESERITEISRPDCPPTTMPFECPPPFSQLPVIKKQIHLEPSRDSEVFFQEGTVDVPANGTATIMSFDTFPTLRTMIRWTGMTIFDALCPSLLTVQIRIEGQPMKWVAMPQGSVVGSSGEITPGLVTAAGSIDMSCLPPNFHNTLVEITDRRFVDAIATNTAPVDRRVRLCLWGWIESICAWDQAVRH